MATKAAAKAGQGGTVDPREVEKFARMAAEWWDPNGPMKPLHALNPTRLGFIRDHLVAHYGRDPFSLEPLAGLRVLDIGCGAGLVCEPLARMGAAVTGLDAAEESLAAARLHAEEGGLDIDYRHATAEAMAAQGRTFDAVLALEIVEHVADVDGFLAACADLVKPGGVMILSTLNRTPKSFLMAIVGAEYVMRWLPRGTHDWRRFLKPSEVTRKLRERGLVVEDAAGLAFNPVAETWRLAKHDLDVNYLLYAVKE
jgi:2-polyprenyl-6-hydroxyphenyl methylase/3-demethylubiquinone-9 3-methyltransferase